MLLSDLSPFSSGSISSLLRYCAESRLPPPRVFIVHDFIDYHDMKIYMKKIDNEVVLYRFALNNLSVFTLCVFGYFISKNKKILKAGF